MNSVLITGGAGFVGSNLAHRLVESGAETHLIVRSSTNRIRLAAIKQKLFIHEIEPTDQAGLDRCFAEVSPETVFHLASQTRPIAGSTIDDAAGRLTGDLGFLLAVAKSAAETPHPPKAFVRAASLAEYGASPAPFREADRLQPLTPYGASMAACTLTLNALSPSFPFRIAQGRLALVYGPGQSPAFLVAQLIEQIKVGLAVEIKNPAARRDLIFIDDAVDGLLRLAEINLGQTSTLNICTGVGVSMKEAAETVLRVAGASPSLVRFGKSHIIEGAQDLWGSPDLAAQLLDWTTCTNFESGVRQTFDRMSQTSSDQGPSR